MFLLEFIRIMCQTYTTQLKEKAMKRITVLSVACALLLLWSSPVLAGAKFDDYDVLEGYDFDISPTLWQDSRSDYQNYLAYSDQEVEIPEETTDLGTLNQQIQSTPSLEGAVSSQDLSNLQLQNIPTDQFYSPDSITTNDEYYRLKWMAEDPTVKNSDPLYRAMFGLYIRNNNSLSDQSKNQILDRLSSDAKESSYPSVPSSYEDYLWMIDEFNQKGLQASDKELLAGYIRADDILNGDQKKALLQDLGMNTIGSLGQGQDITFDSNPLDSDYYSSLATPSSGLGKPSDPHDYAAPTLTDEQIWGNQIYTGQETPFTDNGQPLADYYRDMADNLLDSYRNDTLN